MESYILRNLHNSIVYNPIYVDLAGSLESGILLSQLMYICNSSSKSMEIPDSEFQIMVHFPIYKFRKAKNKLKALPFVDVQAKGSPPITTYTIDQDKFNAALFRLEVGKS